MPRRKVVVLGSTGSIGRQALDVIESYSDKLDLYGISAHSNVASLAEQARRYKPEVVTLNDTLQRVDMPGVEVLRGQGSMSELATRKEVDLVVVGTAGNGGLLPTLAALRAGKRVAVANKEPLVMAGALFREEIERGCGELIPIDSEHSAIWQCLVGEDPSTIERVSITASGGALRNLEQQDLKDVLPDQALAHPNWSMGRKITVDSATLMNKGLEVIEARWLFDIPFERIDVVLHPQSIIHSLVTFSDGSVKAQLGLPDMHLPIQYALSHPERWSSGRNRLDLITVGVLTFEEVNLARYPSLALALDAGRMGGTFPTALAAADEVAVECFLQGTLQFTHIHQVVASVLEHHTSCPQPAVEDILEADEHARREANVVAARIGERQA